MANSYEYCTHSSTHINRGLCCWSGWSRLYRRTQQSYWVVWSRAARNVFFVDLGVRLSYRCFRDKNKIIGGSISRQYVPEHDNRRLNLCLGGWSRPDSSTQRLCWVAWSPRRLHLLPTIIEIPHTLVDIYQSGALLLVRVESPIAAHSSSTGWRGVALPGTVFVDGGVMSSYHIDVPEIGNTYRERIEG